MGSGITGVASWPGRRVRQVKRAGVNGSVIGTQVFNATDDGRASDRPNLRKVSQSE